MLVFLRQYRVGRHSSAQVDTQSYQLELSHHVKRLDRNIVVQTQHPPTELDNLCKNGKNDRDKNSDNSSILVTAILWNPQ